MINYLVSIIKKYGENYTGLPKSCLPGIILTFIHSVSVGICFFLTLYFVNTLHIEISKAGLLISCYGMGTVIGSMVGGKLSDLILPRLISIISLFVQSAAFF